MSISELFFSLILLLASCENGTRISSSFEYINDEINRFDWYLLSVEMQRILPVIMINAQESIGLECFGSFLCDRNTFKSVRFYRHLHIQTLCIFDFLDEIFVAHFFLVLSKLKI